MSQATENCEQPVGESQVTSSEQMVIAIQYVEGENFTPGKEREGLHVAHPPVSSEEALSSPLIPTTFDHPPQQTNTPSY